MQKRKTPSYSSTVAHKSGMQESDYSPFCCIENTYSANCTHVGSLTISTRLFAPSMEIMVFQCRPFSFQED